MAEGLAAEVSSIAEEFFQGVTGGLFTRIGSGTAEFAPGHFEPLAEVGHVLFENWFSATILALVREAGRVADAIEADLQVGAAFVAGFAAAWLARKSEFPAAFMTMPCEHEPNITRWNGMKKEFPQGRTRRDIGKTLLCGRDGLL